MSRRVGWLSVLALLALANPAGVLAHSFEPALLDLHEGAPGVFDVKWKAPGAGAVPAAADVALLPELPPSCRETGRDRSSTDGRHFAWRVDCGPNRLRGEMLSIRGIESSRVDTIVQITWREGATISAVLHRGAPEFVVPGGGAMPAGGTAAVFRSYLRLGAEHILFGVDHLLFVLGLMLLVDTWGMLLRTITAFTLAHSLTLALAVLGLVHVPPAPIEAMIALSIVLLALELTRGRDALPTFTRRYPWAVAFVFGLLHGLGFAGALTQIGLPAGQIPLSLFSFNLGVEGGQLLFVLAMLGPATLFKRRAWRWHWVELVPAYTMGGLAVAWTLERIGRFWI